MSQSVSRRPRHRSARVLGYVSAALAAGVVWAICNNSSTGPDVIVASLYGIDNYVQGTPIDGKRAYAMGTKSLNQGDQTLLWQGSTVLHPVIGQGLYRLKTDADRPGGRLEQIGISWLKHGFTALAQNEFCTAASGNGTGCDNPGTGSLLGLGCSDPYSSGLNGSNGTQGTACGGPGGSGGLGARSEVNASTGAITYPYVLCGTGDSTLRKRLVVADADLDPALNPGARYFGEGQYLTSDDAAAGNDENNASFREIVITEATSRLLDFGGALGGTTQQQYPAIAVWPMLDPSVDFDYVDIVADGRFHVATKVHDLGAGMWRYEYAIHNLNSHRSAQRFEVPVPLGSSVANAGFHDIDYHSGEPYSVADWTIDGDGPNGHVAWYGDTFVANANANALRWGSMYNFWFDSDQAPGAGLAAITLFRPPGAGQPTVVSVNVPVPGGTGLFSDDFETGTRSAWSDSAP